MSITFSVLFAVHSHLVGAFPGCHVDPSAKYARLRSRIRQVITLFQDPHIGFQQLFCCICVPVWSGLVLLSVGSLALYIAILLNNNNSSGVISYQQKFTVRGGLTAEEWCWQRAGLGAGTLQPWATRWQICQFHLQRLPWRPRNFTMVINGGSPFIFLLRVRACVYARIHTLFLYLKCTCGGNFGAYKLSKFIEILDGESQIVETITASLRRVFSQNNQTRF